jgi:peptidoglycan/LPS O-acetylase OafA/YrhL
MPLAVDAVPPAAASAAPAAPAAAVAPAAAAASVERVDFRFADGLRALAAVAVVIYHAYLGTGRRGQAQAELGGAYRLLGLGNLAVAVFIVLSGFVLMLPVARTGDYTLRGGTAQFLRRRARRILPPYYAALALFALLISTVPVFNRPNGSIWDAKTSFTASDLTAHLFLVHNLRREWSFKIDGPMWSVATEVQIYLLMPLLLLPLWRRLRPLEATIVAVCIGWAIRVALPGLGPAHLWYIGLFAMGMLAADVAVRRVRIPGLGWWTAAVCGCLAGWLVVNRDEVGHHFYLSEPAVGVAVALLLAWLAQRSLAGRPTPVHRALQCRPLVWLGLWSYSLYLIHDPLLSVGNALLLPWDIGIHTRFALEVGVVVPLAAAAAYLFHLAVERRFLNTHQRRVEAHSPVREPALSEPAAQRAEVPAPK